MLVLATSTQVIAAKKKAAKNIKTSENGENSKNSKNEKKNKNLGTNLA